MLEYDINFLNSYYVGKSKPVFIPVRIKGKNTLVYLATNRKAKRLLLSDKFLNLLHKYNLIAKNGYIQKKEN
jgi:hypothetical protein